MLDICDTCAFEDACPSAHFNKTESSVCAFYKSLQKDKPDGTYWREVLKDGSRDLSKMRKSHDGRGRGHGDGEN